ncbi:MAG: hypothetical protein P4L33_13520 [Capsulimonadaceae bacterium]|nr:hypothetical protein [Capsulimonadaceae bacterium]
MSTVANPVEIDDPVNTSILRVSEDRIQGFQIDPFGKIAELSGQPVDTVIDRIRGMLDAGTIRRVRQTLMATNLAAGALIAWRVPPADLEQAFSNLFETDPFTGHVVIRSTDSETPGSAYRLWTTLKVPQGFSMRKHCEFLKKRINAIDYKIMPAKRVFALGVGHLRRRGLEPGSRADEPAEVHLTEIVKLDETEWRVLIALKREFAPDEIVRDVWGARAKEAEMSLNDFSAVAERLCERGVIGRFSTFLEHVKPTAGDLRVTRYNALFHWAAPVGREIEAGREVGRHHIMTHAYWREGGPEFAGVNIMGVAHGLEKDQILAHKHAIDEHLRELGLDISYSNVFWGGRSEIKPSEISPIAYRQFCEDQGLDPASMRDEAEAI